MRHRYLLTADVLECYETRELFIELGRWGLLVHWSLATEAEFRRISAKLRPKCESTSWEILKLMRAAVPDWCAPECRKTPKALRLPDPRDRRVLAAAMGVGADVIVTFIPKRLPEIVLADFCITARTPDDVLCEILETDPAGFVLRSALRAQRKRPAMTREDWLESLRASGLHRLAQRLTSISLRTVAEQSL